MPGEIPDWKAEIDSDLRSAAIAAAAHEISVGDLVEQDLARATERAERGSFVHRFGQWAVNLFRATDK